MTKKTSILFVPLIIGVCFFAGSCNRCDDSEACTGYSGEWCKNCLDTQYYEYFRQFKGEGKTFTYEWISNGQTSQVSYLLDSFKYKKRTTNTEYGLLCDGTEIGCDTAITSYYYCRLDGLYGNPYNVIKTEGDYLKQSLIGYYVNPSSIELFLDYSDFLEKKDTIFDFNEGGFIVREYKDFINIADNLYQGIYNYMVLSKEKDTLIQVISCLEYGVIYNYDNGNNIYTNTNNNVKLTLINVSN